MCYINKQSYFYVLWTFFINVSRPWESKIHVNLTYTRIVVEKETSNEKIPLLDWPRRKPVVHFFIEADMEGLSPL